MTQILANLLTAVLVSGMAMAEGTRLVSDGNVLFQSSAQVTFGASYGDHAVRATVVASAEAKVELRVDKAPKNVFLNEELLPAKGWSFAKSMVALTVPAGTTEIQIRFDNMLSLKAVEHKVPVVLVEGAQRRALADLTVSVAKGKARGVLSWPGPAGFFQVAAKLKGKPAAAVRIGLREAPAAEFGGVPAFYLEKEDVLTLSASAPDFTPPLDVVELKVAAVCRDTVKADKASLNWDASAVVEGEKFSKEGGGEIVISTAHKNTHGGACAYSWAKPGHWLEWELSVPKVGDYVLTVVGASQETTILRSVGLDGKPLAGAGVIRMAGTGGWGREDPEQWQPFQPVDAAGKPVRIALAKGQHTLRMTNLVGQHFNVDAILLTPVK
ncbi:MAG: carbohydrate-binding protein [Victivallales bacterium]|nr:carbohydrate-binding protein [Victivallales bacterium]